jgi:hypothetical protein
MTWTELNTALRNMRTEANPIDVTADDSPVGFTIMESAL